MTTLIRCFDKAKECRPDLIILDFSMPVMNGLAPARILKTTAVPIILFSIHANGMLSEAEVGIDALVSKTELVTLVGHSRDLLKAAQSFSS